MRRSRRVLLVLALGFAATLAWAGAPATWRGVVEDVPLRVTVMPVGHEIPAEVRATEPWWAWGDVTDDAYAFAFDGAEAPQLIVAFSDGRARPGVTAELYVAEPGQGLTYGFDGDTLRVEAEPYVVVHTLRGGWRIGGEPNFDLEVAVFEPRNVEPRYQPAGPVWRSIQVRSDVPGVPRVQAARLHGLAARDRSIRRFSLSRRTDQAPAYRLAEPVMPPFPLLGIGGSNPSWWERNPSPLYYDLGARDLEVHNFVGFQEAGIYRTSSTSLPPDVDFESPFAFYGFVEGSRQPSMLVRADSFPQDPDGVVPYAQERPRSSFRYAWRTESDTEWRYALHVAGPIPYTHAHTYIDTEVRAPGYEETPSWVLDQDWPMVTFVEAVDGYAGSEGIYFYTVQGDTPWEWLAGEALEPPGVYASPYLPERADLTSRSLSGLPDGFRGEYHTRFDRPISLYASPVDGRVHLTGAQGGIWNLGGGALLRSADADGDGHVDTWWREHVAPAGEGGDTLRARGATAVQALLVRDDRAYLLSPERIMVKRLTAAPQPVPIAPPRDAAGWRAFRDFDASLEAADRSPWNLAAWLRALPGTAPRTLRPTEAVPLAAGFQGPPAFLARAGTWTAELEVPSGARALQPLPLTVTLRNVGAAPATGHFVLQQPDRPRPLREIRLEEPLAPGATHREVIVWTPPAGGRQQLRVSRGEGEDDLVAADVAVASPSRAASGATFGAPWFPAAVGWSLLALVALSVFGGSILVARAR